MTSLHCTDMRGVCVTPVQCLLSHTSLHSTDPAPIKQVVQSIQATNDLDVHQALLTAPSYQNKVRESYYVDNYIQKALQDYKDNFGFVQVFCGCMCVRMHACRAEIQNACVRSSNCTWLTSMRAPAEKHERNGPHHRGHQGAYA